MYIITDVEPTQFVAVLKKANELGFYTEVEGDTKYLLDLKEQRDFRLRNEKINIGYSGFYKEAWDNDWGNQEDYVWLSVEDFLSTESEAKKDNMNELPKGVSIDKIIVNYVQQCDQSDNYQDLEVSTEDNGGGIYYVIKTDRWAIDNFDDLIRLFEDFKTKING